MHGRKHQFVENYKDIPDFVFQKKKKKNLRKQNTDVEAKVIA